MSITARSLITQALKLAKVISSTETPSAEDAADGLLALNNFVDAWNIERLFVYAVADISATFSGASATIGPSMTINTTRPIRIESAFYRSGDVDYPLTVVESDEYYAIANKTTSGDPLVIYYESTAPTGTVRVWPVPSSIEYHLQLLVQLTEFADLDTAYNFPQGYKKAFVYTLAEEFAPIFGVEIPVSVARRAVNMRRALKRVNFKVPTMTVVIPDNSANRINILTNQ